MSTSSKWPNPVHAFEYPSVLGPGARATEHGREEGPAYAARVREDAVHEAENRLRLDLDRNLAEERELIKLAVNDFAGECDNYYRRVEAEVVQLALAIARRVLRREAEVDPLMLAGVVRVALDNLRAATEIKLHVCPAHAEAWRTLLDNPTTGNYQVTVVEEPLFAPSQCRLESNLGAVELGVDDQLKEIEQGFFDLLAARPR
jgi:flagellar assembly protein FliH